MTVTWTEYFSDNEYEWCWVQENAGSSMFDDEQIAERELRTAFPWTDEVDAEDRNDS